MKAGRSLIAGLSILFAVAGISPVLARGITPSHAARAAQDIDGGSTSKHEEDDVEATVGSEAADLQSELSRQLGRVVGAKLSRAIQPTGDPAPKLARRRLGDRGSVDEAASDIARTFDHAFVVMPRQGGRDTLVTRMNTPDLARYLSHAGGTKFPTVLYLHGCDGLNSLTPLRAIARRGFAVVAPDSFARRFRPMQCQVSKQRGGMNVYVFDFRAAEISYALHRFRRLRWVDRRRLFLVGRSEGGLAAAQFRGREFRARVIVAWTCHGASLVRGLAAPSDEPVLAVVRAGDPWYAASKVRGQSGDCGAFFGARPRSRSLVLEKGGRNHDVFSDAGAIRTILDFLSAESKRRLSRASLQSMLGAPAPTRYVR